MYKNPLTQSRKLLQNRGFFTHTLSTLFFMNIAKMYQFAHPSWYENKIMLRKNKTFSYFVIVLLYTQQDVGWDVMYLIATFLVLLLVCFSELILCFIAKVVFCNSIKAYFFIKKKVFRLKRRYMYFVNRKMNLALKCI